MNVEQRAIADLKPHPSNYNRHPDGQLAVLRESLRTHGLQKPLVIQPDGTVLAGHGLLEAAKAESWVQIACHVYDGPYPEAFLVIDNRSAQMAEPDPQALSDLLKSLQDVGQLEMAGYDPEELGKLLAELEAANPTLVPEEGEIPQPQDGPTRVQPGEVWQLGRHRVMCGDSGKAEDLDALLDGQKLNLIVTSPPYAEQRKEQYGGVPADEYGEWFLPMAALWKARLAEDGSFFLNIKEHCENGERHLYVKRLVIALREQGGWKFVDELCWEHRGYPGDYKGRFANAWEPVFHFAKTTGDALKFRPETVAHESDYVPTYSPTQTKVRTGAGFESGTSLSERNTSGLARPRNVLRGIETAAKDAGDQGHPASYPVGLPSFFLKAYSDEGDAILDPFLGSGTTLIAAEQTGRVCYGMELLPKYCDVILRRYEALTDHQAERVHA